TPLALQKSCHPRRICHILHGSAQRSFGNFINHTGGESLASVEFFSGKKHLQRPRLADQSRQALRATPASDQAESSTALSDKRIGSGDTRAASERQIQPSAHAVARNRSAGAGRELLDGAH